MKGDNWAVEGEDRVIHCECGNEKVRERKKLRILIKLLSFSGMQGIIYGDFIVKHKWYYFAKLCYGLPHCGCKLCYQPPLKRLSEVNFISFADIENEDVETAHEMDNISYKE